jgi:carbonic anhydrase
MSSLSTQVNFPAGNSSLRVGSRTFDLIQFHFHSPSEHAIDGERFDMEAHMVHSKRTVTSVTEL